MGISEERLEYKLSSIHYAMDCVCRAAYQIGQAFSIPMFFNISSCSVLPIFTIFAICYSYVNSRHYYLSNEMAILQSFMQLSLVFAMFYVVETPANLVCFF